MIMRSKVCKSNKMGKSTIITIGLLFLLILIGVTIWIVVDEEKQIQKFCEDNGYDYAEKGRFRWENHYCVKENNKTLIKTEIDICNRRGQIIYNWCFIETEDIAK